MRAIFQWNIGSRVLELGRRTLIMGVVNATPDSFSDGGLYLDAGKAVVRAEQLLDEGATIIDVGGESTRPGASEPVSEEEERRRVLPVIRDLKRRRPDAVISVDTYKASVARAAVDVGAQVVNDVSGFRWDPDSKMAKTLAELKVGAVLMHTRGRPEEWRSLPPIGDPVLVVKRDLRQWAEAATLTGIKRDRLEIIVNVMMTPEQSRAARGWLGWSQADLAILDQHQEFGRGAHDLILAEVQKVHVRAGVDRAQRTVQADRAGAGGHREPL